MKVKDVRVKRSNSDFIMLHYMNIWCFRSDFSRAHGKKKVIAECKPRNPIGGI